VFEWVQDEIVRITGYPDIDEARAAAERLAEERGYAMAQESVDENVRFVLATYEWGNRERKFARDSWHDDGEWINSREDPGHAIHRGTLAIEKLFASWMEAYPDVRVDPVEAQASGSRVFVWVRFSGQGAGSGISLDMEIAHVLTVEDGRIRRLEEYSDRTEALNAAGLTG
jgi:ketosteroid isomerase-like protein